MAKSFKDNELQERYGKSEEGNFFVREIIGVPHPYCITPGHVAEVSDNHGGILGTSAIEAAEKKGVFCGTCRGMLKFKEHETVLLVACKLDFNRPELRKYLMSVKDKATEDGFAGFAFVRDSNYKGQEGD